MNPSTSPTVLILYATTHGQTEKIVTRLGLNLGLNDLNAVIRDVEDRPDERPERYDAVIVAASVHAGHHQRELVNWVHRNVEELSSKPNAFISVSLSNADDDEEARAIGLKYIEDFVRDTRWHPDRCEPVAGALRYREYGPFTRTLMKLLVHPAGNPSDDSHDREYTDWEALMRFAQEISVDFKQRAGAAAASLSS